MVEIGIYKKKGLEIWLEIAEDNIELKSSGVFSKLAYPLLKKVNKMLRNERPIKATEEEVVLSTWLPPIPSEPFRRAIKAEIDILLRGKFSPQAVSMNISDCTLECSECNIIEHGEELKTKDVKNFIGQVQDLGAITIGFAEGDPLLREDLFELIDYVDKKKSIASVFTPGPLLTDEAAAELKEHGVYAVIIGIKSPNPEEHDAARGQKGAFDKAINGMKNAVENGLYVSMHTHVTPKLVESGRLVGIYKLASRVGVHELSIWESHPTWNYKDRKDIILEDKHRRVIRELYCKANSSKEGSRIFYNGVFESPELFGCMAGRRWLNLIHSGDLTPCTYVPISFGNIREESVERIWRRMCQFKEFKQKRSCVMLDAEFRSKYIDKFSASELPINYKDII
ncbi:MAG: radical SAM protein [Methanosarcinales archaeon Met12]|nr:MAG: radical SAM protein [Methanosarcinales archaeon Met12]